MSSPEGFNDVDTPGNENRFVDKLNEQLAGAEALWRAEPDEIRAQTFFMQRVGLGTVIGQYYEDRGEQFNPTRVDFIRWYSGAMGHDFPEDVPSEKVGRIFFPRFDAELRRLDTSLQNSPPYSYEDDGGKEFKWKIIKRAVREISL